MAKAITKRFKRYCEDCEKLYRPTGKFQKYCEDCQKKRARKQIKKDPKMKKKDKRCCICGEPCTGKMEYEARKGTYYYFCTFHFNYYIKTPMREIREKIKSNMLLLKN